MMSDETAQIYTARDEMKKDTHSWCVGSLTRLRISIVVKLEDSLEDDYPTNPHACAVEDGLDGVLNSVEELDRVLNSFADVTPAD